MSTEQSATSPAEPEQERPNYPLHLGLFLATCLTTSWVGVLNKFPEVSMFDLGTVIPLLPSGLPYALSIVSILLTHEMGHFILARRHGVKASLPYFIPIPLPPVGTMGAVIRMEGRVKSRDALADIGASGPLAGLVVAIPVLLYGLHISNVGPINGGLLEGNSLLYLGAKLLAKGQLLPGGGVDVFLSPVAWAGWVGLLVTMLNLMPIGQLDGGHIAYAFFGPKHNLTSAWLHRGLLLLGLGGSAYTIWELSSKAPLMVAFNLGWSAGLSWFIWWILLRLMKRATGEEYHPPVDDSPLSPGRKILCLAMLALFFLLLVPIPLRPSLAWGAICPALCPGPCPPC